MKKQKKRRKRGRQPGNGNDVSQNVVHMSMRKRRVGDLRIFERDYPPATVRQKVVAELQLKPESNRGPDDWWMLGEYLVFDGLMDEDDRLVNEGIKALTQGANHPTPSPACMLDLAWILMARGLDGIALPYLERSVQLAPKSRDAWSLKGLCHVGNSQRDQAIDACQHAVDLPQCDRRRPKISDRSERWQGS